MQYFHWYIQGNGYLYKQLVEEAEYLAELGINNLWLPPAYKAMGGSDSIGYDVYDLYDLGEFDQKGSTPTRYGDRKAYIKAIGKLKKYGIGVTVDIILNHKAGGDEEESFHAYKVDPYEREKFLSGPIKIKSFTKFSFPGRKEKYSAFKWDFRCFTGVDYAKGHEGCFIYQIITDHGDGWEDVVSDELGNYDYLMFCDIEHRSPHIRQELSDWVKWYHSQIQFSGVRIDAVKHQSPEFYKDWLYHLREYAENQIFAVGELWAPENLDIHLQYIAETEGCMLLFDSCLHHNFHVASKMGDLYDLRQIFDGTLVQVQPQFAVTLVANHDTQPLQSLEAPVEPWFKSIGYALILLRQEGVPCVFYPDFYGANYKDKGKDGNEYEINMPRINGLEEMLIVRKQNAYGFQRDYFEDANCLGWTREGNDQHSGCAVLLSNKDEYFKHMEIGKRYAGKKFIDSLDKKRKEVYIDDNGWGVFHCPPASVSVWVEKKF